ncbi:MHO_1580 family protein [Mycoplasma marinum]|uniref:Uncharacterized protein n=1 Tax=Mycoplasma marinum TaxID=1937190 RepID=A0A4R0XQR7_9MOLU|nr:hypothetical protein [Mycoplasma marinum]TCG11225.1 hypothetical protein C4B24_02590 [Mycoplasma marinum]
MIPIILNDKVIQKNKLQTFEEKMEFSTSVSTNGYEKDLWNNKFEEQLKIRTPILTLNKIVLSIKRDLRTNDIEIWFFNSFRKKSNFVIKAIEINDQLLPIEKLAKYESTAGFYKISGKNILSSKNSRIENLSSINIYFENTFYKTTHKVSFGMKSHSSFEGEDIIDKGQGVELKGISTIDFSFGFNMDLNSLQLRQRNMYNYMLLKPIKNNGRIIKNLYDIYEANDTLKNITHTDKWSIYTINTILDPIHTSRMVDYHSGKMENLFNDSKSSIKVLPVDKDSMNPDIVKSLDAQEMYKKEYSYAGRIKIQGDTYYDYKSKSTKVGVGVDATDGYIFPWNAKGEFYPRIKFSPNKAFENISLYRKYIFNKKFLDKNEGQVKLTISSPKTSLGTEICSFKVEGKGMEKIINGTLSLEQLGKI